MTLNPVSSLKFLRMPWRYAKTANDDADGTGGRRNEEMGNDN